MKLRVRTLDMPLGPRRPRSNGRDFMSTRLDRSGGEAGHEALKEDVNNLTIAITAKQHEHATDRPQIVKCAWRAQVAPAAL